MKAFCLLFLTVGLFLQSYGLQSDANEGDAEIEYSPIYRTYYILYKDDTQGPNTVNCTAPPGNYTEKTTHIRWEAPSGITIMPEDTAEFPTIQYGDNNMEVEENMPSAWVQLTSERMLLFHNPDESLHGPYTCHGMQEDRLVYTNVVWVHVMKKYVFETDQRLKIGFLSAGLFFASVALCYIAYRVHGKYFSEYKMAPRDETGREFNVQTEAELTDKRRLDVV